MNTMTYRTTMWLLLCILCATSLLTGCQSSKIAYGNSYYFKQTPKPVQKAQVSAATEATPIKEDTPKSTELLVANEEVLTSTKNVETLVEQAQQQMVELAEKTNNEALKEKAHEVNSISTAIKEGNLSKKEVRAKKKELRQEMRSLVKEYKALAPEDQKQMDSALRLSIILAGAGLLLLIIGGAVAGTGGGLLALLGLLALIGGLVALIIWATRQ